MGRVRRTKTRTAEITTLVASAVGIDRGLPLRPIWLPGVVVLAGLIAYSESFSGPFVFDDLSSIPENPLIRQLWPLTESMSAPPDTTVSGRPIVSLSLAANFAVGELDVRGYHAFNLTMHLLSALVLFGIVRRTLQRPIFAEHHESSAPWLAAAVAMIWTVHPLQTDSVTYIIQRTELLMGLFYLLTLYCALRGWGSSRRWPWFAAAIVFCALGMGSKEVMVTAPVMVLLFDRTFVSGSFAASLRRHAGLYLGLALTWLVLAALLASYPRSDTVGFGQGVTAGDYLRMQAGVIVWYLRLCLWPAPLVISYNWPVPTRFSEWFVPGSIVLALLALTVLGLRRRNACGFLGAWFFLILAPTSSFVPIVTEPAAERRMYLSLAAVVTFVVIGGRWLLQRALARLSVKGPALPSMCAGLVVAAATSLAYGTVQRNRDYRSVLAIWSDTAEKRPGNLAAQLQLANILFESGQIDEAAERYEWLMRLKPDHAETHYNLANALVERKRFSEAFTHYAEAIRLKPDYAQAHNNLGRALVIQSSPNEAKAHFSRALEIKPDYVEARVNIANVLAGQGQSDAASVHYAEALRIDPDSVAGRMGLADLLLDKGAFHDAETEYRVVLRLNPDHAEAHCSLGITLAMQNRPSEAIDQLQAALRLEPHHPTAGKVLADILADQRR